MSAHCSFFPLLVFIVREELCLSTFECEVLLISCWPLQNIQLTICSFYAGLFISWRLSHFNLPLSTFVWSKLEFVIIFCWLVFLIAMHFRLVLQTPTQQSIWNRQKKGGKAVDMLLNRTKVFLNILLSVCKRPVCCSTHGEAEEFPLHLHNIRPKKWLWMWLFWSCLGFCILYFVIDVSVKSSSYNVLQSWNSGLKVVLKYLVIWN